MLIHGLTSILVATALSARPPTPAPSRAAPSIDTEVEVELVERAAGQASSVGFVVPVEGELETWVDRSAKARRCRIEVDEVQSGLRLKLECNGGAHQDLRLEVTRSLSKGTRVRVAEVTRAGGSKSQVFVTLR